MTPDLAKLVKPLVWEEKMRGEYYRSDVYAVRSAYGQGPSKFMMIRASLILGWFQNAEAAQSAADADHAARVLAALDTDLLAERDAEIADLKTSVVAFGAIYAVNDAKAWGLPDGHLRAHFYDILQKAGAKMGHFTRVQP